MNKDNNNIDIDDKSAEFLKQDKLKFDKNCDKKNFYILYAIAGILILVIIFALTQLLSSIDEISEILDKQVVETQDQFTLNDRVQKEQELQKFLGEWTGKWVNKSTGNSGNITAKTSIDNGKVILDIDVNGRIFGIYNPKPRVIIGDIMQDAVYFEVNEDGVFGSVKAKITYDGDITVNGLKIPLRRVDVVNGYGKIEENNVTLDYTVEWVRGIKTNGKVELNK